MCLEECSVPCSWQSFYPKNIQHDGTMSHDNYPSFLPVATQTHCTGAVFLYLMSSQVSFHTFHNISLSICPPSFDPGRYDTFATSITTSAPAPCLGPRRRCETIKETCTKLPTEMDTFHCHKISHAVLPSLLPNALPNALPCCSSLTCNCAPDSLSLCLRSKYEIISEIYRTIRKLRTQICDLPCLVSNVPRCVLCFQEVSGSQCLHHLQKHGCQAKLEPSLQLDAR